MKTYIRTRNKTEKYTNLSAIFVNGYAELFRC